MRIPSTNDVLKVSNHFDEVTVPVQLSPTGQIAYTTPGTYTWVAPVGVKSVSVVAVGAGGRGLATFFSSNRCGGGGGGLGWKNSIPVTPGQSYTVVVGASGNIAQDSYFISPSIVKGGAGVRGNDGGAGGTYVGDGGGNGGAGRIASFINGFVGGGGGGGAGGYTGNGGSAGIKFSSTNAESGTGGGGAGGWSDYYGGPTFYFGAGNGGGGVGIFGAGANGIAYTSLPFPLAGGGGGSGGSDGESWVYGTGKGGNGGNYGGGGAGAQSNLQSDVGIGGSGAVRIIWGPGRAFPSTQTMDL
jgi:hypothetical protein